MKHILILNILAALILAWGCTKINHSGSAAFSIVNAVDSNTYLFTNFQTSGSKANSAPPLQYFATANQVYYGNSWETGSFAGPSVSLSLCQDVDTAVAIWNGTFNFAVGSIHTLFLSGDTSAVDTLLTLDQIPFYPVSDSVVGVRFVNLSRGSLPISVDLQGNSPTQFEFSNLGYRQISNFKQYDASSQAPPGGYTFEIRDQSSGTLLTTISWSLTLFKNSTIVIGGSENPNSTWPIIAFPVNNF